MKYDLGLLDPNREQNRTYQWVMRRGWFKPGFPPDVLEELGIWFAMPGFTTSYHLHNLRMTWTTHRDAVARLPTFDEIEDKVAENWLSITHDDAIQLCLMRRGKNHCPIPLVSQLAILDDIKAGHTQAAISRRFDVSDFAIRKIKQRGVQWTGELPLGFRLLTAMN